MSDKPKTPTKIFIGYTTRTIPDEMLQELIPEIEPDGRIKDEEKKAESVRERTEAWKLKAASSPYLGTFDRVSISIPGKSGSTTLKCDDRAPFGKKPSVASQIIAFLTKYCPNVWDDNTNYSGRHDAVFVGFNPRCFLKMLGLECALAHYAGKPAPVSLWYNNSEHRDIEEAVKPKEFKELNWDIVLKSYRRGLTGDELTTFDEVFDGWTEPGHDAEQDVVAAMTLASRINFING